MKIFATDLDNTIIEGNNLPSEKSIEAIKLLQENNYEIVAVSGRLASSIRHIMKSIDLSTYIIANNGAILLDKDDNILFDKDISKKSLKKLLNLINKYDDIVYHMYSHDTLYTNRLSFDHTSHLRIDKYNYCVNIIYDNEIEKIISDKNIKIYKFAIYVNHTKNEKLYNKLKEIEDIDVVISGDDNIDCIPKDISKGKTLEILSKKLSVDRKDIVSIGDQENDISMIEFSNIGIAMGNGIDELKEKATFVTKDFKDDGFYHAVDKLLNKN